MTFVNRKEELSSFINDYKSNEQNGINQVYIIEANHGIGKSEFIKEVSKYFFHYPIDVFQTEKTDELSLFKNLVLELDKSSEENQYDDFKCFYERKTRNKKAIYLLLKITAIFGQAVAKLQKLDVNFPSLLDDPVQYEKFILSAQTENLYEYAEYVLSVANIHIIFHNASNMDYSSLNILCKLITESENNVFIFESDDERSSTQIEQCLQNCHSTFLKKYLLNKLSDSHIQIYIQQLLDELKLQADKLDLDILRESIEKGDLSEIASILKDYNDRYKKDTSAKIRSMSDIIASLSDTQCIILILADYTDGRLYLSEYKEVINELNIPYIETDVNYLAEKSLIKNKNDYIALMPFVCQVLNSNEFALALKYASISALIKLLNTKLSKCFCGRYVDILIDYYLKSKDFQQLKSMLTLIEKRLKWFNTQSERKEYFQRFTMVLQELYSNDREFALRFARIAYNSNLYFEALDFINLVDDRNDNIIFLKALILNRCEDFEQSREYIEANTKIVSKFSSTYFNLSLVLIMDLIQLDERESAQRIFESIKTHTEESFYPYLIRLSNVFCDSYADRLAVVQSITDVFYQSNDDEFCGLHAVYLAYLYALTKQPEMAEKSLEDARSFWGDNVIYNHMILHNEATIRFLNNRIDEEIPALLGSAKITAYDEYDRFAINNNLLCYYILQGKVSSLECQKIVLELENMLQNTSFKRFTCIIYYNLYHYYIKMFNFTKSERYKSKLIEKRIKFDGEYSYRLMYETSWKLPIAIQCLPEKNF